MIFKENNKRKGDKREEIKNLLLRYLENNKNFWNNRSWLFPLWKLCDMKNKTLPSNSVILISGLTMTITDSLAFSVKYFFYCCRNRAPNFRYTESRMKFVRNFTLTLNLDPVVGAVGTVVLDRFLIHYCTGFKAWWWYTFFYSTWQRLGREFRVGNCQS